LIVFLVMLLRWKIFIIQIPQINHQEYIIGLVEDLTIGVGCVIMMTFQILSLQQLFDCHLTFAEVDVRIMQIVGVCFFTNVQISDQSPSFQTTLQKGTVSLVC